MRKTADERGIGSNAGPLFRHDIPTEWDGSSWIDGWATAKFQDTSS